MERSLYSTGTPWEDAVGYSRAVRVGPFVFVTGTVAADETGAIQGGDAYGQTKFALDKIARVLEQAGVTPADVVRTRMYVTTMDDMESVGRAHHEMFATIRPAATMVAVSGLAGGALVEIEVDAVAPA